MPFLKPIRSSILAIFTAGIFMCGCTNSQGLDRTATTGSGSQIAGKLDIDGSTTVYPIVQQLAEDFKDENTEVDVTVNKSGTGSGFQKFLRQEIDVAAASRGIEPSEDAELKAKGIGYIEIPIAYDGISVVINPANKWVQSLTTDELRLAWSSTSKIKYWSDIRPDFPKQKISFYGPTDNHGTYEYFTEAINKKKGDLREDCQKNQEYNAIVHAVHSDVYGIGYLGFNYYDQNKDKLKVVPIDGGKGAISPSTETIANGTYSPLSRPLFLYVNKLSYDQKPQVRAFVQFALGQKGNQAVKESSYVLLPKDLHHLVVQHVNREKTGTLFANVAPGTRLSDLYPRVK